MHSDVDRTAVLFIVSTDTGRTAVFSAASSFCIQFAPYIQIQGSVRVQTDCRISVIGACSPVMPAFKEVGRIRIDIDRDPCILSDPDTMILFIRHIDGHACQMYFDFLYAFLGFVAIDIDHVILCGPCEPVFPAFVRINIESSGADIIGIRLSPRSLDHRGLLFCCVPSGKQELINLITGILLFSHSGICFSISLIRCPVFGRKSFLSAVLFFCRSSFIR